MKIPKRGLAALMTAVTAGVIAFAASELRPADAASARGATVTVKLDAPGESIRRGVFGSNLQWADRGDGSLMAADRSGRPGRGDGRDEPAGQDGPWQPGLIEAIKGLGVSSLRFPGGALADRYRWKSTIGAMSQRAAGTNFANESEPSLFGLDDFLRLAQSAGTSAVITVNLVAGAAEAADWVEYLNGGAKTAMGAKRSANGFAKPAGVVYWEIGNEPDSPNVAEHLSAKDYAQAIKTFAAAMKARDPSIKVGAALEASFQRAAWMKNVYPELLTWNQEVLSAAGKDIDFVSLHFYVPFDKPSGEDARRELVWAGPEVFDLTLKDIGDLLRRYCKPGVGVAVTEYNVFFGDAKTPDSHSANTDSALFTAMMLMRFMGDSRIELANQWSLLNNNVFGMLVTEDGKLGERPAATVFRELSQFAGLRRTPVSVDGPGYKVSAKGNVPELDGLPSLVAFAAQDGQKRPRLVLVNRASAGSLPVSLAFTGTPPARLLARSWSPADRSASRWAEPVSRTLTPADGRFSLSLDGGSFAILTAP